MRIVACVIIVVVTATLLGWSEMAERSPAFDTRERVARVTSLQLQANFALSIGQQGGGSPRVPGTDEINVEPVETGRDLEARVFRATPSFVTHANGMIVGVVDTELFRLGGFPAPEILGFAEAAGLHVPRDRPRAVEAARWVVRLLEPYGGSSVKFPYGIDGRLDEEVLSSARSNVAELVRMRPDTDLVGKDGSRVLTISALGQPSGYGAPWYTQYCFVIGTDGRLVAWSQTEPKS